MHVASFCSFLYVEISPTSEVVDGTTAQLEHVAASSQRRMTSFRIERQLKSGIMNELFWMLKMFICNRKNLFTFWSIGK